MATKSQELRKARVRKALAARGALRPRLSVFRSSKNIYAQIIDDSKGVTLAAASSLEKDLKGSIKTGADKAAALERALSGVRDLLGTPAQLLRGAEWFVDEQATAAAA